jgi:hypothetical protein
LEDFSIIYYIHISIIFFITGTGLKFQEVNDQNEEGLFVRFLIAVAFKHRPLPDTVEANDKIPKLNHLFYLTKKLHQNTEEYVYSNEGKI